MNDSSMFRSSLEAVVSPPSPTIKKSLKILALNYIMILNISLEESLPCLYVCINTLTAQITNPMPIPLETWATYTAPHG